MDHQEQEALIFAQEFDDQQRLQAEGIATSTATISSSSPMKTATAPVDDNHITRRPSQIHCNLGFNYLLLLKELRVDFKKLAANAMDLSHEMISRGWEMYFARIHGPVYEDLVKDFWRQADCDSHYV